MQTSIATVCLSGSLRNDVRSAAEALTLLILTFAAATVTWLPRAPRF